jgi:hypothetical protein
MFKYSWTAAAALSVPLLAFASSHREAPNISRLPTLDGTDLYMFNSYEAGRTGYVTILANSPWIRLACTRSRSITMATRWRI